MYKADNPPILTQSTQHPTDAPDFGEIQYRIKHLATNKATGPDRISAEIIQAGGKIMEHMTFRIISNIWYSKRVPEEMGQAHIVLLPKDRWKPKVPRLQRPISLTNVWYKLLEKCLTARITKHFESNDILEEP